MTSPWVTEDMALDLAEQAIRRINRGESSTEDVAWLIDNEPIWPGRWARQRWAGKGGGKRGILIYAVNVVREPERGPAAFNPEDPDYGGSLRTEILDSHAY